MGLTLSCPSCGFDSLDESLDALLKSLSFGNGYIKSSLRSLSFNGRESKLKAWGSGKLLIKRSLSFNKRDSEKETSQIDERMNKPSPAKISRFARSPEKVSEPRSPKHEAALKLQKVYKSFRTRRQLADCAVLVEQRWWKLLDFAMLKRSSVSFFDVEKPESALSKWARAKSRAAKVGQGLSKDKKARKLALQHWLEAIDPRHRYGHNLHFYYDRWLRCESKQPFFYWLDVGEGREVSLDDKCPRAKLQQQCIKYLGPKEREVYEVIVEDGKLLYKKSGEVLDTTETSSNSKWIFVLSTSKNLYVGQKKKGTFQHSSFLAGGATSAAGRLEAQNGILKAIWPHSGHYRPTEENFQELVAYLQSKNVDLADVKTSPVEGEEDTYGSLRPSRSELDLRTNPEQSEPTINTLQLSDSFNKSKSQEEERDQDNKIPSDDSEESEGEEEETKNETTEVSDDSEDSQVASQLSLRRKFRNPTLSVQLGKQLSYKWSTGAGPRIGCVRDSPSELRFRALEQVNLSPRSEAVAQLNLGSPISGASAHSSCLKQLVV
ncbi:uncharacterized protein A4U43_C08F9330 [Asparagus officinalis]|uniref:IQ domain-containing protein IQM2-like n=1 Tax=Asparagus officinalis TaxID=4686 RepID=UPI00098E0076|nr:IQ domain-containing protein IQM2-like [Asparagus officinalis]ONK59689.1 uncharacterized protein A4U43_C08F9330 [Asparagus officinalis]